MTPVTTASSMRPTGPTAIHGRHRSRRSGAAPCTPALIDARAATQAGSSAAAVDAITASSHSKATYPHGTDSGYPG